MSHDTEKRRCHRFQIPGSEGRYKRSGLLVFLKEFSEECRVINISKGGLSFECDDTFRKGDKVIIQLIAPEEKPLILRSQVRRQGLSPLSGRNMVGVQFMPFGNRMGWNSHECLETLRRLEARYWTSESGDQDSGCAFLDADHRDTHVDKGDHSIR